MLNRKFNDYIFIGVLLIIAVVVFGIRSVVLGGVKTDIAKYERSNITLNKQINRLEQVVEEKKDVQKDTLFELYHSVPSYYSYDELYFNILSQLYLENITDSTDFNSNVSIEESVFARDVPGYSDLDADFKIVEITVSFNILQAETIENFIERLYNSDQVYIINEVEYSPPQEGELTTASVKFFTFYNID